MFSTISPGAVAQRPSRSSGRSTGPPGSARPTTRNAPPPTPGRVFTSRVVTWSNGPAAASTPGRPAVSAS
ncbi:hypothetical protein ACFQ0T_04475 [Kitasatospora gansuensis]